MLENKMPQLNLGLGFVRHPQKGCSVEDLDRDWIEETLPSLDVTTREDMADKISVGVILLVGRDRRTEDRMWVASFPGRRRVEGVHRWKEICSQTFLPSTTRP